MEQKIKALIDDLKEKGKAKYGLSKENDPEAVINVWYVIARLEEALLSNR